jgi:hypothetical protein
VSPHLPADPDAERVEVEEGEELIVFRIVRTGDMTSPEFEDSFRSHAELGLPPRGAEISHPVIYEGISVYESRDAAIATARTYPRIGSHVAELRLRWESGVSYLRWGARGHLTLWGDPLKISQTAVDTIAVEGGP